MMVSGTGYTGERGVELIIPNEIAPSLWEKLLDIIKIMMADRVGWVQGIH